MAAKPGKSQKAQNTASKAALDTDDVIEDIEGEVEAAVTTDDVETPAPVAAVEAASPEVAQPEENLVRIAMFVEVDPAPTIGHPLHGGYSFAQNGILKLEARKSYTVPRNVADVLIDKKLAGQVN